MAKRFQQADISSLSGRTVFFDANILIYLFWPVFSKRGEPKHYAAIFGRLLSHKNPLALNTFILSEVINRVLKMEWEKQTNKSINFKSFRNSSDGRKVQKDVFDIIQNKILTIFAIIDKPLTLDDLASMLAVDTLDFNDKIILAVCKTHDMILLTNDADFAPVDVDILSANPKLR